MKNAANTGPAERATEVECDYRPWRRSDGKSPQLLDLKNTVTGAIRTEHVCCAHALADFPGETVVLHDHGSPDGPCYFDPTRRDEYALTQ